MMENPAKPVASTRRNDIDGLRAVALIGVILYHAGFTLSRGFFIGVDIFFVISGYFIALSLLRELDRGGFSLGGFYLRRFWRIIPPLGVVALCCIIPAYLWATPLDFIQFGHTLLSVLTFVSNYFFYSQGGYFDAPLEANPFLPTWFLSVQVQFYIVFPLIFLAFARWFPKRLIALLAALFLGSLALSETLVRYFPTAAYFLLFSRLWELLLGSLIATLCHRGILRPAVLPGWAAEGLGWAAVAVIALCGFVYGPTTPFPGLAALPVCLGAAALVVLPYSSRRQPSVSAFLGWRPVVLVGLISYSVYLWHWPVFVYFKDYLMVETLSRQAKLLAIGWSFAIGLISWALLERGLGNARLGKRAKVAIMLVPAMVALALLAVLSATSGMPGRYPPAAQPYIAVLTEAQETAVEGETILVNDITPEAIEKVRRGNMYTFGKGDAPRPVFLAWGDSHVFHLRPLLAKVADELSIQGLFLPMPGHPPLMGVYRQRWDSTANRREAFMEITRAAVGLVREKRIPVVLLGCYWWFYPNNDLVAPLENGEVLTGFDALAQGLHNTVSALEEAGCEVWILRDVPFYPVSVPHMIMRILRADGDPGRFRLDIGDYRKKVAGVQAVLDEVERLHPRVRFIDPAPTLCPDGVCLPEVDNRPLYFDDNHLSKFGAMYLEPAFADLTEALQKYVE